MKRGVTRKIQLERFGGKKFESQDFWIESDNPNDTFDSIIQELYSAIAEFIHNLPQREIKLDMAIPNKPAPLKDGEPF